jgi:hypothetical protein
MAEDSASAFEPYDDEWFKVLMFLCVGPSTSLCIVSIPVDY